MTELRRAVGFTALAMVLGAPFAAGFGVGGTLAAVGYMASPLLAAVVLCRREGVALREGIGLRWAFGRAWLGAWAWPLAAVAVATALTFAVPGVGFDPTMEGLIHRFVVPMGPEAVAAARAQLDAAPPAPVLLGLMLVQGVVAGSTINALAAFGEEAGWRGWMHRTLEPLGFWRRAAVTGVLWGLWHAPLILQGHNYPDHPVLGVGMMVGMCLGLAAPMAHVRERTGTALSAAVFHGVFNAVASVPLLFAVGGSDLTVGVTGVAGLVGLAGLNGVVAWRRR